MLIHSFMHAGYQDRLHRSLDYQSSQTRQSESQPQSEELPSCELCCCSLCYAKLLPNLGAGMMLDEFWTMQRIISTVSYNQPSVRILMLTQILGR